MPLPDIDSFATLGGELAQYSDVEDPTTDLPAAADNASRANVAAMTRMVPRAYAVFFYDGATTSLVESESVWGNDAPYRPTIARTGTGVFTLTYPATVPNARSGTSSLNLRRALGQVEDSTTLKAPCQRTSASVITVRVCDGTVAADPTNKNVVVFIW